MHPRLLALRSTRRLAAIVGNTLGVDAHNHIDVPLNAAELPGPKINLGDEIRRSGLSAIVATFAVDYQKLENEGKRTTGSSTDGQQ